MVLQLVVDTNVLAHASNPQYSKQNQCIELIDYLMASDDILFVDDNEPSHIEYEYENNLHLGMLGYTLLLLLRDGDRYKRIARRVPDSVRKVIDMTGIKKGDRIFVKVAFNTDDKVLVTQEYEDFTKPKRKHFKKEIGVRIIEALDCLNCLNQT